MPLLARCGGPRQLVAASDAELRAAGLGPALIHALHHPDTTALARTRSWLAMPGHRLLTWDAPDYPPLLREISDPPVALFLRGDAGVLELPQIGIVGSRRATAAGHDTARNFAIHLGRAGFAITSGLARGIDATAHSAALASGARTIAVCGAGPDVCYPRAHRALADRIAAGGAVITEFPPGVGPRAAHFPRRNRLISGLSVGVLVVEAGIRSGALITARLAASQGREVFAVPGSIREPLHRGCHHLLRQGAALAESPADIVAEVGSLLGHHAQRVEQNMAPGPHDRAHALSAAERGVLTRMGWEAVSVDQLVRWTGLTAAELCSMLVALELAGCVVPLAGGRFQRREEGRRDERNRA